MPNPVSARLLSGRSDADDVDPVPGAHAGEHEGCREVHVLQQRGPRVRQNSDGQGECCRVKGSGSESRLVHLPHGPPGLAAPIDQAAELLEERLVHGK